MLDLFHLVLQIAVILVAARIVGFLFQKINQPQVMGEMVAGILLGPSLLGWLAPGVSAALFPPASLSYLNALSQVGLVVFMFVVGLALNPSELHGYGHAAVLTSHVSIVAPFCLGGLTALYLYPRLSDDGVTFTHFALFMGAAMSITAFPVLARILTERGLLRSRMGTLAIACAAVDDVTGWCILAYIVVLVRVAHAARPAWVTIAGSLVYVLIMLFVVRRLLPAFERAFRKRDHLSDNLLAVIVVLVLASALATEWLGIHLLFGAFLMGAIMPKTPDFTRYLLHKFESVTVVLLLPLFFAYTGLRTRIGVGGGTRDLALQRDRHCGGHHRKAGRVHVRGAPRRHAVARGGRAGHSDEHARPDGTGDPEHRPGYRRDFSGDVLHHGADGAGDHVHDHAIARVGLSNAPVPGAGG